MVEQHKHCVACGEAIHILAEKNLCKRCLQKLYKDKQEAR